MLKSKESQLLKSNAQVLKRKKNKLKKIAIDFSELQTALKKRNKLRKNN